MFFHNYLRYLFCYLLFVKMDMFSPFIQFYNGQSYRMRNYLLGIRRTP
jgi:hypothetical protein